MKRKTWTKNDLIEKLSLNVGVSHTHSSQLIEKIFNFILLELENNKDVKLSSFGSFVVRHKKTRLGRNPKTGIQASINARNVVTFNPSNILKSKLK